MASGQGGVPAWVSLLMPPEAPPEPETTPRGPSRVATGFMPLMLTSQTPSENVITHNGVMPAGLHAPGSAAARLSVVQRTEVRKLLSEILEERDERLISGIRDMFSELRPTAQQPQQVVEQTQRARIQALPAVTRPASPTQAAPTLPTVREEVAPTPAAPQMSMVVAAPLAAPQATRRAPSPPKLTLPAPPVPAALPAPPVPAALPAPARPPTPPKEKERVPPVPPVPAGVPLSPVHPPQPPPAVPAESTAAGPSSPRQAVLPAPIPVPAPVASSTSRHRAAEPYQEDYRDGDYRPPVDDYPRWREQRQNWYQSGQRMSRGERWRQMRDERRDWLDEQSQQAESSEASSPRRDTFASSSTIAASDDGRRSVPAAPNPFSDSSAISASDWAALRPGPRRTHPSTNSSISESSGDASNEGRRLPQRDTFASATTLAVDSSDERRHTSQTGTFSTSSTIGSESGTRPATRDFSQDVRRSAQIAEEMPMSPTTMEDGWHTSVLGFFDPQLPTENESEEVVWIGNHRFFCKVGAFITAIEELACITDNDIIRDNLHNCLKGTAYDWYESLTESQKSLLRQEPGVERWVHVLFRRFRNEPRPKPIIKVLPDDLIEEVAKSLHGSTDDVSLKKGGRVSVDAVSDKALPDLEAVRTVSRVSARTQRKKISSMGQLMFQIENFIHEWTPFTLVVSYFVFSTCIYMVCTDKFIEIFWFIYLTTNFYIAGATVIEAFMSIEPCGEARKAAAKMAEKNWVFPTKDSDLLILDLVMVAYLPNEKDIILDRILYACEKIVFPKNKIRINIVYNTPHPIEPLETAMLALMTKYKHLRIIKVPWSTSKADNLNHFLSLDTGSDIIAIYDTDHYPHPYGPRFAVERMMSDEKIDIVQGRCIIYNSGDSFQASMIAVEFDKIYAVSHPGRAAMWGFGLFAGSNGYWRTSLLKSIKMDGGMLTEDIDSSLRAFSRGAQTYHDLNVISYEMAPTTFQAFWKQRLRWAQGWAQASIKHMILSYGKAENTKRPFKMRFGVVSLLLIREASYYLVTQYCCFVASLVITRFPKSGDALWHFLFFQYPVSEWMFVMSFLSLISTLWITNRVRSEFVAPWMMVAFSASYPFYLIFMAMLGIYGHARQISRYSSWNPTPRS